MIAKMLFRSSVIWTTPLGLPVVQPYRSAKRKLVSTKLASLALQEPGTVDPVSKRKQLQGFPPNFIHSLDATHMMLSANKCYEHGITFASIHDSFWTHASDINNMSRILRDAFVDMHSEDVVGRLRHEFTARYQGAMYLAAVDIRTPVGKKIAAFVASRKERRSSKSTQPFQVMELLFEKERMRLLESEDSEQRKRGEEMETCGSIFAAEAGAEGALALPAEIRDAKLGEIPDFNDYALENSAAASASAAADLADPVLEEDQGEEGVVNEEVAEMNEEEVLKQLKARREKVTRPQIRKVHVWLPLQFPAVPEKGTFDVRRLRESVYFFH